MNKFKTIIIFTGEFPYGKRGEPFLETEIIYLANQFNSVYLIPQRKSNERRSVPKNVKIADNFCVEIPSFIKSSFLTILQTIWGCFLESIISNNGWRYLKSFKFFLTNFSKALFLSKQLKKFLECENIDKSTTLFYTYWSDLSLLACGITKKSSYIKYLISRVHRFDLYEDQNEKKVIPFQTTMYNQCSRIYSISQHGYSHLEKRLSNRNIKKLRLSYLGVDKPIVKKSIIIRKAPLIISCARLEKFKRICFIPDILQQITIPINWIHFGDGPEMDNIYNKIKSLPNYINASLEGQVSNKKILEFYSKNKINLFLSLSISEGLPVSMMEAISYGIPIMAIKTNGVPEIVNNKTGVLISPDANAKTIAKKIEVILQNESFTGQEIKSFFRENFDAAINYSNFVKEISHWDNEIIKKNNP